MSIKLRFFVVLIVYILAVCGLITGISLYFMHASYAAIARAPNPGLVRVMADAMLLKAALSYLMIIALVIAVSLILGVVLSRMLSGPYLAILGNLTAIAQKRLALEDAAPFSKNERVVLNRYIQTLVSDQEKLRDYEKVRSWKDGARLVMHELKNPLTPLKLAAQSLTLESSLPAAAGQDLRRILVATADIEKILGCFKELVNIDFGHKVAVPLRPFLRESFDLLQAAGKNFACRGLETVDETVVTLAEPTLLRMLINNLIVNGLEASPEQFTVAIADGGGKITVDCLTPGGRIEDPARLFRLGYSQKGPGRGLGLFLSRMISEYLDLGLEARNCPEGVVFSFHCRKMEGA
jgi:signal transduction histidine kinase